MKRREFIALLGAARPRRGRSLRAQPQERLRRIGAIMGFRENDSEGSLCSPRLTT